MGNKGKASKYRTLAWVLGIVAVLAIAVAAYQFSVAGSSDKVKPGTEKDVPVNQDNLGVYLPEGVTSDNMGKAATLSLAAYDQESNTKAQVAVPAYTWRKQFNSATGKYDDDWTYMGATTLSATARTSISGFNVGDKVRIIAFNGTYPYGDEYNVVVQQTSKTQNLDVHKGTTAATITFYDKNDNAISNPTTTGNVSIGTTKYEFKKIAISGLDDQTSFSPKLLVFGVPTVTNISEVRLSGATEYSKKINRITGSTYAFEVTADMLNNANTEFDSGAFSIVPNGNNIISETVTAYVIDEAPFIDTQNQLQYGVQDDRISHSDVGISDFSQGILLT